MSPDEPSPTGRRREARERALALLYEADSKGLPVAEVLAALPVEPDPFAAVIVKGVAAERGALDALIERFSVDWRLERMPVIDLEILRMATFELARLREVPTAVAISEAVSLAKEYSTEESGRFVNGLLSRLARELRGGGPDRRDAPRGG
ncbi:MAG: Transcription antitermination protein NusB [Acidimicrobiales bacterium]|nr:MAG: transcription antitermination factor NusB [Actinomycetota bacterium]MBV6507070.1 Transcription antitermination protein NusB [Acidimicrobiales bacterium]RIK05623.1 MAG: transcription antitermination factor NusB [Acidobacteriota bacterium]